MKLCVLCNPTDAYEVFAIKEGEDCDYAVNSRFWYGNLISGIRNFIIDNEYAIDKIFVRGPQAIKEKIKKDIELNFPNVEVE